MTGQESGKKKAVRSTSNVFALFTKNQIAQFKEAFQFIDSNKDGIIDNKDLHATFSALGKVYPENEIQSMIAEAPGPINFTVFLSIFGSRIAGIDSDDVVRSAFKTFDTDSNGKVHEKVLRKALMTYGNKLNEDEIDDAFNEAPIDSKGFIHLDEYVDTLCGQSKNNDE